MRYLSEYGFSEDIITYLRNNIPKNIVNAIDENQDLVVRNILFLKELEISNYVDIFKKYYSMFLMDNTNFSEVFNKYDKEDLIDKINKNIAIVEYL